MHSNTRNLRRNRKAASPAVSMIVITAATVVLVLVSSLYALQVLSRQEAQAEFSTVQNSVLAFDDALRDIAWDRGGSRSVRFATKFGNMLLIDAGDSAKSFEISASGFNGTDESLRLYELSTAVVKYQMPYDYGISGTESYYILGNESVVVSRITDSLGQALVKQESGFSSITLNYRVRVSEEGYTELLGTNTTISYVDIFIIRLNCNSSVIGVGDFDLVCKNVGLETISRGPFTVNATSPSVLVGTDSISLDFLESGDKVIFNLIISDVRVST